jgi:hypothetical protein
VKDADAADQKQDSTACRRIKDEKSETEKDEYCTRGDRAILLDHKRLAAEITVIAKNAGHPVEAIYHSLDNAKQGSDNF